MNRKDLILLCLFHKFCKPVVFDDGFHPVEGCQIDNHRLFLVLGIRNIFSGYRIHTCIIPVFIRECIKELVWTSWLDTHERVFPICATGKSMSGYTPHTSPAQSNLSRMGIYTGLEILYHQGDPPVKPGKEPLPVHAERLIREMSRFIKPELFKHPSGGRAGAVGDDLPEPAILCMGYCLPDKRAGNPKVPVIPANANVEDVKQHAAGGCTRVERMLFQFTDHGYVLAEMLKKGKNFRALVGVSFVQIRLVKTEDETDDIPRLLIAGNKAEVFCDH